MEIPTVKYIFIFAYFCLYLPELWKWIVIPTRKKETFSTLKTNFFKVLQDSCIYY